MAHTINRIPARIGCLLWAFACALTPLRAAPLAKPAAGVVVVSDIDDTIKWTHVRCHGMSCFDLIEYGLSGRAAFAGMPELYSALAHNGATFVYVTGEPDVVPRKLIGAGKLRGKWLDFSFPRRIITEGGFPKSVIIPKPYRGATEQFKISVISSYMRSHPEASYILIGDNGQRDVASYRALTGDPELGAKVKGVFIHELYSGRKSMKPGAGQQPFLTAAGLAAMLYASDMLDKAQLVSALRIVDRDLRSTHPRIRNLAFPFAADISPAEMEAAFGATPIPSEPEAARLLNEIQGTLRQRFHSGPAGRDAVSAHP